jgi:hypothetical protein
MLQLQKVQLITRNHLLALCHALNPTCQGIKAPANGLTLSLSLPAAFPTKSDIRCEFTATVRTSVQEEVPLHAFYARVQLLLKHIPLINMLLQLCHIAQALVYVPKFHLPAAEGLFVLAKSMRVGIVKFLRDSGKSLKFTVVTGMSI